MHNDFVRNDGQWPPEFVLTPNDLRRFDVAQFQAMNGNAGGTWVPLKQITIGGQALALQGGTDGHQILGGVLTLSGGRLYIGASLYPRFQTSVSRVINWPLLASGYTSLDPIGTVFSVVGVENIAIPIPSRQMHNGGTLVSANVSLQVGSKHLVTPGLLPQAQLVRDDWAPWEPGLYPAGLGPTVISAGAIVAPSTVAATPWGLVYVASGAGGTTSGSEPFWLGSAATINSSVTDGSVTWVATGYSSTAPAWIASHAYSVGVDASTPTASNGLLYVVTSISGSGTSAATEPAWPLTIGATVIDNHGGNQVVWTCVGSPRPALWTASTTYNQSVYVSVSNGFYYQNTHSGGGTSGSTPPVSWGTTVGGTTTDGTCTWLCIGTNPIAAGSLSKPASADAYFDGGATQTMIVPCSGTTTTVVDTVNHSYTVVLYDEAGVGAFQSAATSIWEASTPYVAYGPASSSTKYVQPNPASGYYYECIVAGTTSSSPPTWPVVLGGTVVDGSVHWQCVGPTTPSLNAFLSVAFSFIDIVDMRPE